MFLCFVRVCLCVCALVSIKPMFNSSVFLKTYLPSTWSFQQSYQTISYEVIKVIKVTSINHYNALQRTAPHEQNRPHCNGGFLTASHWQGARTHDEESPTYLLTPFSLRQPDRLDSLTDTIN